jgi:hypothetical protein
MERSRTPGGGAAGRSLDPAEDYGVPVPRMDVSGSVISGTDLAAGSIAIDKCLSRMFVAAYLLTGSPIQAEAVVLESIRKLDIQATRDGCLSWKAIAGAIVRGDCDSEPASEETPATPLPVELARVLRLSPRLRQCFVLRILMAMPRHYCAGLLRIDAEQVDADSCQAARELANMVAAEAAN